MRALLLAAGMGTRLRPLTEHLPKCLVPIHGRPLLDYWLQSLIEHGVDEILINTHYQASVVAAYVQSSTWKRHVTLVHEERLLGTGGTILENRCFLSGGPFLVAHADNLTLFDARAFARQHAMRPAGTALTMMLFESPDPRSCGIVELDDRGIVHAFHEKTANPPGNLANAAVYVLEPSVIDFLQSLGKTEIDFSTEVIPHMLGRIYSFRNSVYHRDIGTMQSWAEANRDFPIIPGSEENAAAWTSAIEAHDPAIAATVERLLRGVARIQ